MIHPMTGSVSSRGVVQQTDFDFTIQQGLKWTNPFAVDDIQGFFPDKVWYGYNTRWCESITDLNANLFDGMRSPELRSDMVLIVYPSTETRHAHPIYALAVPDKAQQDPVGSLENFCTGYNTLLDLLDRATVQRQVASITQYVSKGWTQGDDIPFCPYVWQSPTFHTDKDGRPTIFRPGNGPRGQSYMTDPEALGQVLNGKARYFPSTPPLVGAF
jgi:hypothetical protein